MENPEASEENDALYRIRHSLSHVLAQAVVELRPGATLGFGPPIDDGFYYDFILPEPITESDFPAIERRMKQIIKKGQAFEREELPAAEALARIEEMGEPYKQEYARELLEKRDLDSLTFYRNGPFLDMCEGPHVENTRKLPRGSFKLRSVAGAYWRGDSRNVMMTRLYAWAFETKEDLETHVKAWREAQARDHKKLGRELDIFAIDDEIGKGLPLWLPNGTIIRDELEKLARELEFKAGYKRVVRIPPAPLSRMAQIKVSLLLALTRNVLEVGQRVVCLAGPAKGPLDLLFVTEVGGGLSAPLLSTGESDGGIHPEVLGRALEIAVELGSEGREGKPVGTLFVLGDMERVKPLTRQMILNPFFGYPEDQRNLLDDKLTETLKELATVDGAFLIRSDGVIESAGTFLKTSALPEEGLPSGLGARHQAASGISLATDCVAITVSQSTGRVCVFRDGEIVTELDRAEVDVRKRK